MGLSLRVVRKLMGMAGDLFYVVVLFHVSHVIYFALCCTSFKPVEALGSNEMMESCYRSWKRDAPVRAQLRDSDDGPVISPLWLSIHYLLLLLLLL
jgi:hypothetical protein